MPVALISVPGTCAQHVVRAPTCMPMPMFARGPHVSASVQLCMNKFMCNLFKCVHKACGCRFRQSSQLVRSQLFPPSRSCPPHSPAPQFPHNLPTHNFSHFCHLAQKAWIPELSPKSWCNVFKLQGPKQAVEDGLSMLGPILTEKNTDEWHQKVLFYRHHPLLESFNI